MDHEELALLPDNDEGAEYPFITEINEEDIINVSLFQEKFDKAKCHWFIFCHEIKKNILTNKL